MLVSHVATVPPPDLGFHCPLGSPAGGQELCPEGIPLDPSASLWDHFSQGRPHRCRLVQYQLKTFRLFMMGVILRGMPRFLGP